MSKILFAHSTRGQGPTPYLLVHQGQYMTTLRDMLTGELVLKSNIRFYDYETLPRVLFF